MRDDARVCEGGIPAIEGLPRDDGDEWQGGWTKHHPQYLGRRGGRACLDSILDITALILTLIELENILDITARPRP
jgi:hypothetical protein